MVYVYKRVYIRIMYTMKIADFKCGCRTEEKHINIYKSTDANTHAQTLK